MCYNNSILLVVASSNRYAPIRRSDVDHGEKLIAVQTGQIGSRISKCVILTSCTMDATLLGITCMHPFMVRMNK